jgi:serine/threonine protein kinase
METPDIPVKLIKNRFVLQEDIGQGGYGSVCKAVDKLTNEIVAVKFNKKIKNFKIECGVMEHLNKFKFLGKLFLFFNTLGFPRLINYGVSEGQNYIVTEFLGTTLKQILTDRAEGPFSIETVCLIGI